MKRQSYHSGAGQSQNRHKHQSGASARTASFDKTGGFPLNIKFVCFVSGDGFSHLVV